MYPTLFRRFLLVLISVTGILFSVPYAAQEASPTSDRGSARNNPLTFKAALQKAADQAHVVIVAEGIPLREELPKEEAPDLTAAKDAEASLTAIAAAFDYDCVRKRPDLFVLVKRYSDPRDVPGVMLEELGASLQDILRLLDPFDPKIATTGQLAREIFATLTPEQIAAMKKGTLQVSALASEQRRSIRKAVDYFSVGWKAQLFLDGEGSVRYALSGSLCHDSLPGQPILIGYRFHRPEYPQRKAEFRGVGPQFGEPPITIVPKVDPSEWVERFNQAETLKSLCQRLSEGSGVTFEAAPELQDKPITVIRGSGATVLPERLADAVADAYGLRLQRSGTQATLRRPRLLVVKDQSELSGAVRALIPAPIRRALRIREIDPATKPQFAGLPNNRKTEADVPRYTEYEVDENARLLGREATRLLAQAFNEELRRRAENGAPVQEIPVAQTDRFSRAALSAILSFAPFASTTPFITSPPRVPRYVTEFDNLYVSGEQFEKKGKTRIAFHLGLRDPKTGRIVRYVGVSDAPAVDPARAAGGNP